MGRALPLWPSSLFEGQSVPYARTSQLLHDLLGVQLSVGSIATFVGACHHQLAKVETQIKAALMNASVIHQDETGLRVGPQGQWVHVCSTDRLTHYAAHPKRGREALQDIDILPHFAGTSVHDGLASYQGYACRHALCNVHHLRELTFVQEELTQPWAGAMKALLLDMKQAVAQARAAGSHALDVLALGRFHRRYDALIQQGYAANPPPPPRQTTHGGRTKQHPARNLLDRLSTKKWQVLAFLTDFAVPFDNNQAERDLRMSHPCSKKSLAVFAQTTESRSFVAFAVIFRPCANKASTCFAPLSKRLWVIPFSLLFEPLTE